MFTFLSFSVFFLVGCFFVESKASPCGDIPEYLPMSCFCDRASVNCLALNSSLLEMAGQAFIKSKSNEIIILQISRSNFTVLPSGALKHIHLIELKLLEVRVQNSTNYGSSFFQGLNVTAINLENVYFERTEDYVKFLNEAPSSGATELIVKGRKTNLQILENTDLGSGRLRQWTIEETQLTEIAAKGAFCSTCKKIIFRRNELQKMAANAFYGNSLLEDISFPNNKLSFLPDGLFSGLNHLKSVSFTGNPALRIFGENVFDHAPKTVAIYFTDLDCDCKMFWLLRYEFYSNICVYKNKMLNFKSYLQTACLPQ